MEFSEKLQKLRTNEKLTQEELAEKLYVSRAAISKWESGRGYPSIDSLKAIAKYFHVTIDELIGTEEIVDLARQDIRDSRKKIYFPYLRNTGMPYASAVISSGFRKRQCGGNRSCFPFRLDRYQPVAENSVYCGNSLNCAERFLRSSDKQF